MNKSEAPNVAVETKENDQVLGQRDPIQALSPELATPRVATYPHNSANAKVSRGIDNEDQSDSSQLIQTPLHNLIEAAEDDETGLEKLESKLHGWKHYINTRAPNEFQESALHMLGRKGFYKMAKCLIYHGANICVEDSEKAQPLHLACKGGNMELVNLLLSNGAPIDHLDSDGYLPLHWASRYGCDAVISQLLGSENKFLNQKVSSSGQTPLGIACDHDGQGKVVNVLLEHKADLRIMDNDEWTPLFTAVARGNYAIWITLMKHPQTLEGKLFDTPDNEGTTPLMQLCCNASREIKEYRRVKKLIVDLLELQPKIDARDNDKRTALHFAVESALAIQDTSMALKIIDHVADDFLLARDRDGYTAFDPVFDDTGEVKVLSPVLKRLTCRLNPPNTDIEDLNKDLLFWMIENVQRHRLAQRILSENPAAKKIPKSLVTSEWHLMEWVTYYHLPGALFQYIMVESEANGFDEHTLRSNAKRCRSLLKELGARVEKLPSSRDVDKGKKHSPTTQQSDRKLEDDKNQDVSDMHEILDLCFVRLPPKRDETLDLLEPHAEMKKALSDIRATVLQSYESYRGLSQVYRFCPLEETVYGSSAIETYTETIDRLRSKLYKPKDIPEREPVEARFTWIHLPSANIDWMQNIMTKILKREDYGDDQNLGIMTFFRDSWVEIPDQTSSSRFMRPRYVERRKPKGDNTEADSDTPDNDDGDSDTSRNQAETEEDGQMEEAEDDQSSSNSATEHSSPTEGSSVTTERSSPNILGASALYLPYLEYSFYHRDEDETSRSTSIENVDATEKKILQSLKERITLLNAYRDSAFHGPSTLDDFYYHFADNSNGEKTMRNKTQVVTKYLYQDGVEKFNPNYWSLLRVSQLWIWIIDDRWLISCTSSTMNQEKDDFVTSVLKYLSNEVESGSGQKQPTSANDMSRAIADYCIYTYERKRKDDSASDRKTREDPEANAEAGEMTVQQAAIDPDRQPKERKQWSIRHAYSEYVNEIGRKESRLFGLFSNREWQVKRTGYRSFTMEELDNALGEGATQLHRIKDVRDELNILKTVARYQLAVRSKMSGETKKKEDLLPSFVLSDIVELDNNAKQMHDAFISTISLQESEIANFQAQEAVKQGKKVGVFTVVTVWFLPLSFLTSLFALDVSSFLQAPAWALVTVFTVPLLFLVVAVVYMYHADKAIWQLPQFPALRMAFSGLRLLRLKDKLAMQEDLSYTESTRKTGSTMLTYDIERGLGRERK